MRKRELVGKVPSVFADGDTVVFIGDSITQSGLYVNRIYEYYLTRFPGKKLRIVNGGINGDTGKGVLQRLDTDILPYRPTKAVVMLGMNDLGRDLYAPGMPEESVLRQRAELVHAYWRHLTQIIERLAEHRVPVWLVTPSPYDQTAKLPEAVCGYNDALHVASRIVKEIADAYRCPVIDFHQPMTVMNEHLQSSDPTATIIGNDRVHPGEMGHMLMAYFFLTQTGVPVEVAGISIDASRGTVVRSSNCEIAGLSVSEGGISFQYWPNASPMLADDAYGEADILAPITAGLNQERIIVNGLKTGRYTLYLDGDAAAEATAREWEAGVNLALLPGNPGQKRARYIHELNRQRRETEARLRNLKYVEISLQGVNLDPEQDDQEELKTAYSAVLKGMPWHDYCMQCLDSYLADKKEEDALLKALEETVGRLHNVDLPEPYPVSIIRSAE
ncbi:SGNH/GDSL hydrolase family protein [Cohnella suwonensis]|uniref:SGNH/GDSL hydrolase family protein n=1 Tax=Cohnella suwonensis TaxID=696072 RepID=A0ABW0LRK6_9BACL